VIIRGGGSAFDLHFFTHASSLSSEVIERLTNLNLDLIIHCGDYTGIDVVHQLQALGKFCGVAGNMDSPEIKNILREKEVIAQYSSGRVESMVDLMRYVSSLRVITHPVNGWLDGCEPSQRRPVTCS